MREGLRGSPLYDKIHGCLLGAAIGDAFGIRLEMMHYRDIEAQYGRVTHFDSLPPRQVSAESPLELFNPFRGPRQTMEPADFVPLGRWGSEVGVYTDDMRYRLMICQAVVRKRGPITGADLATEWFNYRLMAEGAEQHERTLSWSGPQRAFARMLASLPGLAGMMRSKRPCIAGWDGPLGLVHAGDPARAAAVGSSMAVAIATAMLPDATIEQVIANVFGHADVLGAQAPVFVGRLNRLLDIAAGCRDVFELREPFYREFLVTFPPWEGVFTLEMVPCALALCLLARGDFEQAIIGAANMGRDADTLAAITGELMGALVGVDRLPRSWAEKVARLNPEPDLAEMAETLSTIVVEQAREQRQRAEAVLSLAGRRPGADDAT